MTRCGCAAPSRGRRPDFPGGALRCGACAAPVCAAPGLSGARSVLRGAAWRSGRRGASGLRSAGWDRQGGTCASQRLCPTSRSPSRPGRDGACPGTEPSRYSARRAVVIGSRAARSAGNSPPTTPMPSAHFSPLHSSAGETLNWNTTWLKFAASERRFESTLEPRFPSCFAYEVDARPTLSIAA